MKNRSVLFLVATMCFGFSTAALAEGPCYPKHEAKHSARKALHDCIHSWQESMRPEASEPSDDCSDKLSTFIKACKELKSCRADEKKKHEEKRAEKQKH